MKSVLTFAVSLVVLGSSTLACVGVDENGNIVEDPAVGGGVFIDENADHEGSDGAKSIINAMSLFDDKYCDGHDWAGKPTPVLPPGKWDWNEANNDLANWKNFETTVGTMSLLKDIDNEPYGWRLNGLQPSMVDFAGPAAYFEGSAGRDIVNLGAKGKIHSFSGRLSAGPDVLVFNSSYLLDFSTSEITGSAADDDDLLVAGCDVNNDSAFDIKTTTIHTGSGADELFVRDAAQSAFDSGNLGGMTSDLDPQDGDDVTVLRGNMLDFRTFGGTGNDTVVWYADEVRQNTPWLGPNFFGGGGSGAALWDDQGTDRLVLAIPRDTKLITSGATQPGQLLVRVLPNYNAAIQWDAPTVNDPKAKYCVTCGVSPTGRKTVTLEYRSANGAVNTGYFWVTAFEELQIGVGADARVYSLNDVTGVATLTPTLAPYTPPTLDPAHCAGNSI